MQEKDIKLNKSSEGEKTSPAVEEKKKEVSAMIQADKLNPYKIMLIVDVVKAGKLQSLGIVEEFKDLIKFKIFQYQEERKKLNQLSNKWSMKGFLNKKLW
jgi:hypothetical protein